MTAFLVKTLISALLIAGVSELGRRSTFWAAVLIALPLTSVLAMVWIWRDTGDAARIAQFSTSVFWLVLPSLLLFVLLPLLLQRLHWDFWPALLGSVAVSVAAALLLIAALKRVGINL